MRQLPVRLFAILLVAFCLLLFALAGMIGGPSNPYDVTAIHRLAAERAARIGMTGQAVLVTQIGGVGILVSILLLAVALLAYARRWRDAVSLTGIVIGGRLAIELLKLVIDRPRPSFGPYPVDVASLSFPSGHAGNSMVTFLTLALVAAPARMRTVAVPVALLASLVIGATRPLLGVHWPSDVLGGWAFGIGWVVALSALTRRWRDAAE